MSNYIYKPDELIQGSIQIFIKNENYDKNLKEINDLIADISETFSNNEDLNLLISELTELSNCFGKHTKIGYSESSPLAKGIGKGNKLENIPDELKGYSEYLKFLIIYLKIKSCGIDLL